MKLKIKIALFLCFGLSQLATFAQEGELQPIDTLTSSVAGIRQELDVLKRIKVSGYIQAQFQYADSTGAAQFSGGTFNAGIDKRIMLRRARLKVQYDAAPNDLGISTSQYVLQFDATERGFVIKDLYAKFTDPWSGWFSATIGNQNRPFGFEIGYSSSLRESPERGRMSQIIFPNERDMGAMLTIQGPKTTNWNWLKLEAGLFNGTGGPDAAGSSPTAVSNTSDYDKRKDLISHLSMNRSSNSELMKFGLGVSYYDGGFLFNNDTIFHAGTDSAGVKGYTIESSVNNKFHTYSERKYIGADAQFSIEWLPGMTTLRGEYIQGDQPGISSSTASPKALGSVPIYKRKFNGAYFYFLQNILQTPFQAIVKYDWYDPNTDLTGDEIGKSVKAGTVKSGSADLKYTTIGLGLAYRWDANLKITFYYDMVKNETSNNLSGFTHDLKDNVVTLRAQMKF